MAPPTNSFSEIVSPSNGQHISAKVVRGNDLFNIVRPLQVDGHASGFGEIVIHRSSDERPGERAVGRRLAGDLAQARGAVIVPAQPQSQGFNRFGFHTALPYAV